MDLHFVMLHCLTVTRPEGIAKFEGLSSWQGQAKQKAGKTAVARQSAPKIGHFWMNAIWSRAEPSNGETLE
jgi:hypothetical protein